MRSLRTSLNNEPRLMRQAQGWLTIFWVLMIPASLATGWGQERDLRLGALAVGACRQPRCMVGGSERRSSAGRRRCRWRCSRRDRREDRRAGERLTDRSLSTQSLSRFHRQEPSVAPGQLVSRPRPAQHPRQRGPRAGCACLRRRRSRGPAGASGRESAGHAVSIDARPRRGR